MPVRGDIPDPTELYRIRDGIYAADLLIAAVAEFDLFSWLAAAGPVRSAQLRSALGIAERPADVLLTYCAALGLVERDLADGDRIALTELARPPGAAPDRPAGCRRPRHRVPDQRRRSAGADEYEVEAYTRVRVTLESGSTAWVYVFDETTQSG